MIDSGRMLFAVFLVLWLLIGLLSLTGCAALAPAFTVPPDTPPGETVMVCVPIPYAGVSCQPMRQQQIGPSVHGDFTTPPKW